MAAFYPPSYGGLDRDDLLGRVEAGFRRRQQREVVRWLAALRPARGRLLDAGCGAGDLLAALRADGWDVAGVEPASPAADARAAPPRPRRSHRPLRGRAPRRPALRRRDAGRRPRAPARSVGRAATRTLAAAPRRPRRGAASYRAWTRPRRGASGLAGWRSTCRATSPTSTRRASCAWRSERRPARRAPRALLQPAQRGATGRARSRPACRSTGSTSTRRRRAPGASYSDPRARRPARRLPRPHDGGPTVVPLGGRPWPGGRVLVLPRSLRS